MAQTLDELLTQQVARFTDRKGDWDAFADARVEGYRRAQHRFIGSGASGKADASVIPAEHFTLSVMFVPPGEALKRPIAKGRDREHLGKLYS